MKNKELKKRIKSLIKGAITAQNTINGGMLDRKGIDHVCEGIDYICEGLTNRILEIMEEEESSVIRKISDAKAKKEISAYIIKMKKKGKTKLSILNFVMALELPALQIERIMKKFTKEGKVKEI